jgi:glycogen debranching enzyme
MQALQLAIYNLAHKITREAKYKDMEKQLKNKVRFYFWNGKMLADGKNDWAIRPDIFLTYYIYPALLKKSEWENCFETALKALWLDWGGLSTVDKNSPFYYAEHTGENPRSYHQGDSWFWINNIAAISMIRLNKKKYLSKIKKILEASTKDLLWYGAIGHSSELSSAEKFSPAGSISQAWSAATYIELVDLFNTHNT